MKPKLTHIMIGVTLGLIFLLTLLLVNASSPLTVKNITLENIPDNRLRFKVLVSANRRCNAIVKYWQDGHDTLISDISSDKTEHTLWVVNTKARSHYSFQVTLVNGKERVNSKVYALNTKTIFQATPYFTLDFCDSAYAPQLSDRFFLTQKLSQPGSAMIIDRVGNIVWYQAFKKGAKVTHWTSRRTVLCILGADSIPFSGGDEIAEINLSGEVIRQLKLGEGAMDKMVHHDVRYDNEGNLYALTFDKRVFDLRNAGGKEMDSVLGDGIVMFNDDNEKIWEWSVFDHLDPLTDCNIVKDRKDWVHANALYRDHDGNFLISFRDLSQVWKIDHKSGHVLWKLGRGGDFTLPHKDLFSGQHAVYSDLQNQVIMLDNGVEQKVTRVLAFAIDPHSHYVHATIDVPLADEYFSIPKGNAFVFDTDKILVCASDPKVLLIIDKMGRVLWKMSVGGDPYRVELIENLNHRVAL